MPIEVRDHSDELIHQFRNALCMALAKTAESAAMRYRAHASKKTHPEFPLGNKTKPYFKPPHSKPGQYPDRETGQGVDSIDWGVDCQGKESRFGVRGEQTGEGPRKPTHKRAGGMHLAWLVKKGRKGPKELVEDELYTLRWAFRDAARSRLQSRRPR